MSNPNTKRNVPGLGERVRALRKARNISQQVCATRAGVSIPRLADCERHGLATTETLNLIARTLGVTIDELTGRVPRLATAAATPGDKGAL